MQNVVIVDYGMGNVHSVYKQLIKLNCKVVLSSDANEIERADKIILPGVGHFRKAMERLNENQLIEVLNREVLDKQKPILGICLGLQLMMNHSEEGNASGLGWVKGKVTKFTIKDTLRYKVPHMGWNTVSTGKDSLLMKDIIDGSEFYFVHSFHLQDVESEAVLNTTHYEYDFTSAIQKNNIFGVQYHPEKSHAVGRTLLNNFITL